MLGRELQEPKTRRCGPLQLCETVLHSKCCPLSSPLRLHNCMRHHLPPQLTSSSSCSQASCASSSCRSRNCCFLLKWAARLSRRPPAPALLLLLLPAAGPAAPPCVLQLPPPPATVLLVLLLPPCPAEGVVLRLLLQPALNTPRSHGAAPHATSVQIRANPRHLTPNKRLRSAACDQESLGRHRRAWIALLRAQTTIERRDLPCPRAVCHVNH